MEVSIATTSWMILNWNFSHQRKMYVSSKTKYVNFTEKILWEWNGNFLFFFSKYDALIRYEFCKIIPSASFRSTFSHLKTQFYFSSRYPPLEMIFAFSKISECNDNFYKAIRRNMFHISNFSNRQRRNARISERKKT